MRRIDAQRRDIGADREGGSRPAPWSRTVIIDVVVDLPWVPATVTTVSSAMVAARASERCSTGSPAARAAASSGLSGADRGACHDRLGVAEVPGGVADVDPGAGGGELGHDGQVLGVGAADRQSAGHHDAGDGGHADPADADEVDPAEGLLGGCGRVGLVVGLGHGVTASCRGGSGTCGFEDEPGHAPVRVADAELSGAGCHPGEPVAVLQQRDDVVAHPVGGERVVCHDQGAAGLGQAGGVERLFAVADREGHEDRGHADGGDLADGGCPGPGQQQAGCGVDGSMPSTYSTCW